MMTKFKAEIIVYGAEQLCPSCVNLPSSKETVGWLEAAISRKFPDQPFEIFHVDIYNPPNVEAQQSFAKKVVDEDMFYPVVVLNDKIVGEGNPKLKTIFAELEKLGYRQ